MSLMWCQWTRLAFILSVVCMLIATEVCRAAVSGYVSTSVLNMTFTGASSGWPTTTADLAPASSGVTSAVCAQLPPEVTSCSAFLTVVNAGVIALQMQVDTDVASNASITYQTLYDWSQNAGSPPTALIQTAAQNALGTGLSTLAYQSGAYSMPCRGQGVYSFLPVCSPSEPRDNTTFYVLRSSGGSGDVSTTIVNYLCAAQASCEDVKVVVTEPSGNEQLAQVTITGAARGLEAVLAYVSAVRSAISTSSSDVLRIEMRAGSMTAALFSVNETQRYAEEYPVTLSCAPATGMWAIALIAIIPIALVLFRYVWYRGRKHAKKVGRERVIADEQRIMQGYTTTPPADTANAADPPPGVDASAFFGRTQQAQAQVPGTAQQTPATQQPAAEQEQQWVMDEQGNYYLMNAEDAVAATTTGDAATSYTAPAANATENGAAVDGVEMEQLDPTENSISYQTYVDPNTGEMYQYVVDPQAADAATAQETQETGASEAPEEVSTSQYVQYVDPNSGETFYYDANAVAENDAAQS